MENVIDPESIIEKIGELLEERYIFLDKAREMRAYLDENGAKYCAIVAVNDFAKTLTADLRSISRDMHLHVDYNPVAAAELAVAPVEDDLPPSVLKQMANENYGFQRLDWLPGGIGYLDLRMFAPPSVAGDTAVAAMNFLANAKAIIFDLRQNGGGDPQMVQLITSYLVDPEIKHLNSFYTRHKDEYTHFWTLPYVPGKRNPKADVYVLTSSNTFSGAEEFAYNIKAMKHGSIVGETTGGGAHPGADHALSSQFIMFVPDGRAINPITQTNWEGTGVEPDISVLAADALKVARREAMEKLLDNTQDEQERGILTHELALLKTEGL